MARCSSVRANRARLMVALFALDKLRTVVVSPATIAKRHCTPGTGPYRLSTGPSARASPFASAGGGRSSLPFGGDQLSGPLQEGRSMVCRPSLLGNAKFERAHIVERGDNEV